MANTRHHNANTENNTKNNNVEKNNVANPLMPPPPTLDQVLVMQAQMLQTMQNTQP
jgi:hypothetical protein